VAEQKPDAQVEIVNPLGQREKIDRSRLAAAIGYGAKELTPEALKAEADEKLYGDQPIKASALAFGRGLSLGATDYLSNASGFTTPEELSGLEKYNPALSTTFEIGGNVAPILLSGGTGALGKAATYAPAAIAENIAAKAGAKILATGAAETIKSGIIKKAIKYGTVGTVEGMFQGGARAFTEDAMGDAELNAESILSNIGLGAVTGGAIGSAGGALAGAAQKVGNGAFKRFRSSVIDESLNTAAEKAEAHAAANILDKAEDAANSLQNSELIRVAKERGWATTPGQESTLKPFRALESSLSDSPSAGGMMAIKRSGREEVENTISKEIGSIVGDGAEIPAHTAGKELQDSVVKNFNESIEPAKRIYTELKDGYAKAPITSDHIFELTEDIANSKYVKFSGGGESFAKRLGENIKNAKTLEDLQQIRRYRQQDIRTAMMSPSPDHTQIEILSEVVDRLKQAEQKTIEDAAFLAGGEKLKKEVSEKYAAANKLYATQAKRFQEYAKAFGVRGKSPTAIIESIKGAKAEAFADKFLKIDNYDHALALKKELPDAFEAARRFKLGEIKKEISTPEGIVDPNKFVKKFHKMDPKEMDILLGFNKDAAAKVKDLATYIRALPTKTNNSSRSAIELMFQKVLSPAFQAVEMGRYALYSGGNSALKKHFTNTIPTLGVIEHAANKQKGSISSAVKGFFSQSRKTISREAVRPIPEKKIERAIDVYDKIQEDPDKVLQMFIDNNRDLFSAAPNTANALQSRLVASVQFLQSKIPRRGEGYLENDYKPSKSEVMAFSDYLEGVDNPNAILDGLKTGYVSPRGLEAMKVVYPRTIAAVQAEMLARMPKVLTNKQRMVVQQVLGAKALPAMTPAGMALLQSQTTQEAPERGGQNAPKKINAGQVSKMKVSERNQTGLDRTLYRS